MDERKLKKLETKRKIKDASGLDSTKELVQQAELIDSLYSTLDEEGLFDSIKEEEKNAFDTYVKERNISLWSEPYRKICQLIDALQVDYKNKDFSSYEAVRKVVVAHNVLIDEIQSYCDSAEPTAVEKYQRYDRNSVYYGTTESNFKTVLETFYNDAYEMLNDALSFLKKGEKSLLLDMSSIMAGVTFFISEVSLDMKQNF